MKLGILLSGGMDSVSLAWWKRPEIAFTVNYGQLAANAEVSAARTICNRLSIEHCVLDFANLGALGSGDMNGNTPDKAAPASDWWPYRNQLIVTLAAMKAIRFDVTSLLLGVVKSDCVHQDGTPEFLQKLNDLMTWQEGSILIEAPAIGLSTLELIEKSKIPLKQLAWAHSCHKSNFACGNCRGCNKYFSVRKELGYGMD